MHFLRDPVAGLVAVIAGIVVVWIVYLKQRRKKALEYRVLSSTSIFNPVGHSKFELRFEGQPVEDVQLVILKFANAGNAEVNPEDYHQELEIEFSSGARVLSAEIRETSPQLTTAANASKNRVVFPPVLLNAGDWFTVQCLVASFKKGITVRGRISGVQQIRVHPSPNLRAIMSGLTATFAGMIGGLVFLSFERTEIAGYVSLVAACASMVATGAYLKYGEHRQTRLFG